MDNQTPDLFDLANRVIKDAAEREYRQGINDLCRYRLELYRGFVEMGCSPAEATQMTVTSIEAMIRSARRDQA